MNLARELGKLGTYFQDEKRKHPFMVFQKSRDVKSRHYSGQCLMRKSQCFSINVQVLICFDFFSYLFCYPLIIQLHSNNRLSCLYHISFTNWNKFFNTTWNKFLNPTLRKRIAFTWKRHWLIYKVWTKRITCPLNSFLLIYIILNSYSQSKRIVGFWMVKTCKLKHWSTFM